MTIRVAIVDDHRLVREGLKRVLSAESEFVVVAEAGRGGDVQAIVVDHAPDVLLLDIALPDIDGLTVIDQVLKKAPETRVLMLSMHAEPEYSTAAVARGAYGLVGKSVSAETLFDAIRTVASGEKLPLERTLSSREREVLKLITNGRANGEIAVTLGIRPKTVEGHCERLMRKLDIHTRAGLVAHGRRIGLQ